MEVNLGFHNVIAIFPFRFKKVIFKLNTINIILYYILFFLLSLFFLSHAI